MDYRKMLEDGFREMKALDSTTTTRLEYLSDYIFDFTTYDGEIAEEFARKALEVCAAISDRKTFDYIADDANYRWYLLMCNMPFFADRLEWGTSIRGAWWKAAPLQSCGLFLGGEQLTAPISFTDDEWLQFVVAMREFAT